VKYASSLLVGAALAVAGCEKPHAVLVPAADERWGDVPGYPGMKTAMVDGDPTRGAARFFLKLAPGLTLPKHHHTADHYGTVVAGTVVLTTDQGPQLLGPGSYFSFVGQDAHATRCAPEAECVLFIDARARWDVVLARP
jgi:quercetin dioxygenase-like cupin family protein